MIQLISTLSKINIIDIMKDFCYIVNTVLKQKERKNMAIFGLGDELKKVVTPKKVDNKKTHHNNKKADEKAALKEKMKAKKEAGGCEFC
jgi:hypothetical protein